MRKIKRRKIKRRKKYPYIENRWKNRFDLIISKTELLHLQMEGNTLRIMAAGNIMNCIKIIPSASNVIYLEMVPIHDLYKRPKN